ncbi:hypothetical protein CISG_08241 [Coccidioides immitis RMSCC 3703]|uniref:Uncharacterized protein n=2 Tax=Coccidioides immitis TaxID=5501 RepID=A0A0J8R8S3_COCIT|nr:hypothetical protein CIRG_04312 [Coccidioides immitis RMSCC 2394]KMU80133.1 hypothetical protein CISG_08241 [Coccidioides immitis RMSCC 3703]
MREGHPESEIDWGAGEGEQELTQTYCCNKCGREYGACDLLHKVGRGCQLSPFSIAMTTGPWPQRLQRPINGSAKPAFLTTSAIAFHTVEQHRTSTGEHWQQHSGGMGTEWHLIAARGGVWNQSPLH